MNPATIENYELKCSCEGKSFEVTFSNGLDGKTLSLWCRCAKCKKDYVFRKPMKMLEEGKA